MLENLKNWLSDKFSKGDSASTDRPKKTRAQLSARPNKTTAGNSPSTRKNDESAPNQTTRRRSRLIREETGTHETLTIIDDSLEDQGEEAGFDPYNTGAFDRSKNWNSRSRK
jgi:hypothetical protein